MKKKVYFENSKKMKEVKDNSIDLIITSPPYFNIKDYSKNGDQSESHSSRLEDDISNQNNYEEYINSMLDVWKECMRVLRPNGKLCINVPLMPMLKKEYNTHYNRHIFDLNSDIQQSILNNIKDIYLMDLYIWKRTNSTKKLMFGSYPFPGNFYAQNIIEFIAVYVKDGQSEKKLDKSDLDKLSKEEWVEYTKQIWEIPIPNKGDVAFGKHSAIMPEEIPRRLIKLFSFTGETVLDPFTGSGTTGKVALSLGRNFVGYEMYQNYEEVINTKLSMGEKEWKKTNKK